MTSAVASVKRLQLVPNWNGMMMPETTPIPNETANIRVQKPEMRNQISPAGEEIEALEHRDVGRKPDGEGRQQDVPRDHPAPLHARKQNRIERHGTNSVACGCQVFYDIGA